MKCIIKEFDRLIAHANVSAGVSLFLLYIGEALSPTTSERTEFLWLIMMIDQASLARVYRHVRILGVPPVTI